VGPNELVILNQSWIFITDPNFAAKAARVLDLYARVWTGNRCQQTTMSSR